MKAILVLDEMPKSCCDCCLTDGEWSKCVVEWRDEEYNKRPSWCPLKPMPKKMNEEDYRQKVNGNGDYYEQVIGWNACIEELDR